MIELLVCIVAILATLATLAVLLVALSIFKSIGHDLRPSADGTGALLAGTGAEDMLGIISHTRYKNNPRSTNTATTSAMTASLRRCAIRATTGKSR